MRIQVTLSLSESKRLIAKGIVFLDMVQNALKNGIIGLASCTTNGFILEELTGKKMENKGRYSCGVLTSAGTCLNAHVFSKQYRPVVIVKGQLTTLEPGKNLFSIIDQMDDDDIIIKSGNVLDPDGDAAVMVGDLLGGEIGQILSPILTRGINLIVPMTLNKTIPIPINRAIAECGAFKIHKATGMRVGLLPLPGLIFTEIDAIKKLTGAETIPIAMGSSEGECASTLIINGAQKRVEEAWKLIDEIKGEPNIKVERMRCRNCFVGEQSCQFFNKKYDELPIWMRCEPRSIE